jgi:hypothetical protein
VGLGRQEQSIEVAVAVDAPDDPLQRHRLHPAVNRPTQVKRLADVVERQQAAPLTGEDLSDQIEEGRQARPSEVEVGAVDPRSQAPTSSSIS